MIKQTITLLLVCLFLGMGVMPLASQTIPPITPQLEDSLLAILASDAPFAEKAAACRQLGVAGTAKAVPVLSRLLADEKLAHMARYALETLPDPVVDQALRESLDSLQGQRLVGVIGSIGVRQDNQAVSALSGLLGNRDAEVSRAAMRALGSIGSPQAVSALQAALPQTPTSQRLDLYEGLLRCAEVHREQGHTQAALAVYTAMNKNQLPHQVRSAAIRGEVTMRGAGDLGFLRQCLSHEDYTVFSAAVSATLALTDQQITRELTRGLADRSEDQQVLIAGVLGLRGDLTALEDLHALARKGQTNVRLAALKSLSQMGQAATVPLLVSLTEERDPEIGSAAATHLAHFPNRAADGAIREMLGSQNAKQRLIALQMVAQRRMAGSLPALLQAAADPDIQIRTQALKSLAELGGSQELLALLVMLPEMKEAKDLDALRQALTDIAARSDDPEVCVSRLVGAMGQVNGPQKVALLRVLSSIGGRQALAVVRLAADDSDEDVRLGAIRALGSWSSVDAAPELLALVKLSDDSKERTLCLRGYLTLAGRQNLSTDQRLTMCKQIAPYAQDTAARKQWLGVLGRIDSPKALAEILPFMEDPDTKDTACAVSLAMIERLVKKNRGLTQNPTVRKALQTVIEVSANTGYQDRARKLLAAS
jgi:HEAT repeat protein